MTDRSPGEGRYAHLEREQRWLLDHLPDGAIGPADIYDRYITGTRLRLRRVERAGEVVYKLGQKVRAVAGAAERVKITNIYLSLDEYEVYATLEAHELRKRRWHVEHAGRSFAVDEFVDRPLILAEVELSDEEPRLATPPFAVRDITDDDRYSGGALAATPGIPR